MSELPSAMFSIADGNEFRVARFYIVCEAIRLGALERPPIVCGLSDTLCGLPRRGKDTEFDVRRGTEEILGFYSKELSLPAASGTYRFLSLHTKYMPFYASEIRQLFFL